MNQPTQSEAIELYRRALTKIREVSRDSMSNAKALADILSITKKTQEVTATIADEPAQPGEYLDFVMALKIVDDSFNEYRLEQPKWWKKMDGTPILNDLPVKIASAFAEKKFVPAIDAQKAGGSFLENVDHFFSQDHKHTGIVGDLLRQAKREIEALSVDAQKVRDDVLEECAKLAVEWGNGRKDLNGGHALRNYAQALYELKSSPAAPVELCGACGEGSLISQRSKYCTACESVLTDHDDAKFNKAAAQVAQQEPVVLPSLPKPAGQLKVEAFECGTPTHHFMGGYSCGQMREYGALCAAPPSTAKEEK